MHLALSNRSALSGSFVANQMQDRQFPLCHCMPFNRFCSSDSGPDMMFQCLTEGRYQGSRENIPQVAKVEFSQRSGAVDVFRAQASPSLGQARRVRPLWVPAINPLASQVWFLKICSLR